MSVITILIVASFGMAIIFLVAFLWAVKKDQYEDTQTPAMRIFFDDNDTNGENKNL